MSTTHAKPKAFTVGEIARQCNEPIHRINYIISSRGIEHVEVAGRLRIFDQYAVERVGLILQELDEKRERGSHV